MRHTRPTLVKDSRFSHHNPSSKRTVILVGNPNVGKSVIFAYLTGRYAMVSNYPGTTVEFTRGYSLFSKEECAVIDTPGINSLHPMSEDEKVTLTILLGEEVGCVLQVADSKNLRRALLVTSQLSEMGVPLALILNMSDEADGRGIRIDHKKLSKLVGIPVIKTVATSRKGLSRLPSIIGGCPVPRPFLADYGDIIEASLIRIAALLPGESPAHRLLASVLLANPDLLGEKDIPGLSLAGLEKIKKIHRHTQSKFSEPLNYLLHQIRIKAVDRALEGIVQTKTISHASLSQTIARISMHPLAGIPILFLILTLVWLVVARFAAGTCVDFLQNIIFGRLIIPFTAAVLDKVLHSPFLRDFLIGDFGIISMALTYAIAIVLPIVGFFFLVFGLLEDSGYLPRLAVMSNKVFRFMGLNGRAVLPMVLGLGCATMATLTTRILDTKKERILVTFLLALGVPCSAQLGVILGLLAGLPFTATLIWGGVILCTLLSVGHLSSKIIPGREADFIMELPPIRPPQISNILSKTWTRVHWYLREAVPLFIIGTLTLFVADKTGLLAWLNRVSAPLVVHVLGLPSEATAAFIVGFLRRDYGAVFLMDAAKNNLLDGVQVVVSLITITLFVPCIANFFMMIKERGIKTAFLMILFIFPFAFAAGGVVNVLLRALRITF